MPVGCSISTIRWLTIQTAFTITASAIVICRATRIAPVRLRRRLESMGRMLSDMGVSCSSLALEIPGGRQPADRPGRIEAGGHGGQGGEGERPGDADDIEVGQRSVAAVAGIPGARGRIEYLHRLQSDRANDQSEDGARGGDRPHFHEVLPEDLAP